MSCTEERGRQLGELAGGRLDSDAFDELLVHVESCESCSSALDLAAALVAVEDPGKDVQEEAPSRRPWLWAAAAGVFLAIGLTLSTGGRRPDLRSLADLTPLVPLSSVLRSPDPGDASEEAWGLAMERYRAEDWRAAAERLAALSAAGDARALVGLYEGLAWLQVDELTRGADVLEAAAERGDDLVLQRCLWYAAQARLALDEGEAARAILEQLVELDREFEPNARVLLERLASVAGGGP